MNRWRRMRPNFHPARLSAETGPVRAGCSRAGFRRRARRPPACLIQAPAVLRDGRPGPSRPGLPAWSSPGHPRPLDPPEAPRTPRRSPPCAWVRRALCPASSPQPPAWRSHGPQAWGLPRCAPPCGAWLRVGGSEHGRLRGDRLAPAHVMLRPD